MLFILITSFTMLNLFIAVIIDATQTEANTQTTQHVDDQLTRAREEIVAMHEELRALRESIERGAGPIATR